MLSLLSNYRAHSGFFAGTPPWRPDRDMPDMTGKVVVVTGANTGIGFETAKHLVKAGAKVYALSRTPSKGEEAVKKLNDFGYKGKAVYVRCDLADLSTLRKTAEEILGQDKQIHALINNAGIMLFSKNGAEQKTAQGHEIQCGTNVLGHHFLTNLLKPGLIEAAAHSEKGSVRIVFVSSSAHFFLPTRHMLANWDLSDEAAKKYREDSLYGRSKLGNVHQMHIFADELESKGVIVSSVHPGNIKTELQRYAPEWQKILIGAILWSPYYGSISQLYAATAKDDNLQRTFLAPWARRTKPFWFSTDKALIAKTKQWCDEQSKGF